MRVKIEVRKPCQGTRVSFQLFPLRLSLVRLC